VTESAVAAAMVVSVRLTVLGACGAWPEPGQACSGFLVEHDGFRLLVDAGYATMPRLLEHMAASQLDAVYVSHGHPDHCADLNPLLRARAMGGHPAPPLPVYALPGALDAVLALDRPGTLAGSFTLCEITAGRRLGIGPFDVETRLLPHWVPNAGLRLAADGTVLAYTGDSGPDPAIITLARDADVLLAEATYPGSVPSDAQGLLSSVPDAARQAARAGAARLVLTHLWPGTSHDAARTAAEAAYSGPVSIAVPGLTLDLS
jgi:ribonuclease BN (tRNA processing enzyme)